MTLFTSRQRRPLYVIKEEEEEEKYTQIRTQKLRVLGFYDGISMCIFDEQFIAGTIDVNFLT